MPSAYASTGTLQKIGDGGGSEAFTTIKGCKDITLFGFETNMQDSTSHDASGYMTNVPTLKKSGQVTFDLFYTKDATQGFATGLYADWTNRTLRNFQTLLTTGDLATYAAYVSKVGPIAAPVDGLYTMSVTLEVQGAVTWS
jgi:hypothetical protein